MGPIEHGERCSLKLKFSEGTGKMIIIVHIGIRMYEDNTKKMNSLKSSLSGNKHVLEFHCLFLCEKVEFFF